MSQRITPEEVEQAIQKLRFPKPKISSDEASKKAIALFTERPEANHCAPSTVKVLQEAYDLPGGELPGWIATGFRGGICLGETCGALSGAVITLGLMSYKVLEPRTDHEQRIACQAIAPYIRDIVYNFNFVFGSINCAVLTRREEISPVEIEIGRRTGIGKDVCSQYVDFVVRKMVNWGEISQEPPPCPPSILPPLKLG